MTVKIFPFLLFCAFAAFPAISRGDGIPHPPLIVYGTVYNQGNGHQWPLGSGRVTLSLKGAAAPAFSADIIGREGLNYRLRIPAEITLSGESVSPGAADLSGNSLEYRLAESVWVEVGGKRFAARLRRDESGKISQRRSDWGGARRLDFFVEAPLHDSDGDGMPDGWEAQFASLDPQKADAGENPDHDTSNNLAEFHNGTNPEIADDLEPVGEQPVWAMAGAYSQAHIPLQGSFLEQLAPGDQHTIAYTLVEAPDDGRFFHVENGALQAWDAGDAISDRDVRAGKLLYLPESDAASEGAFTVDVDLGSITFREEIKLRVWSPRHSKADLRLWFDGRQLPSQPSDIANLAPGDTAKWTPSGDVELLTDAFAFGPGGLVRASGADGPLEADELTLLAAFAGEGTVLAGKNFAWTFANGQARVGGPAGTTVLPVSSQGPTLLSAERETAGGAFALANLSTPGTEFAFDQPMPVGASVAVGGRTASNGELQDAFAGEFFEVVGFSGAVSPTEQILAEAYLKARWEASLPVIVDAVHAPGENDRALPEIHGPNFQAGIFLGWQSRNEFTGGNGKDQFYVGGGEHRIHGGAGADEVVFLLPGGQNHAWLDFDPAEDVLDLAHLFAEPTGGELGDYLRAQTNGADALLELFPEGAAQTTPALSIRLAGQSGLDEARLREWLARGTLRAGSLGPPLELRWELLEPQAVESTGQAAVARVHFGGALPPEGTPVALDVSPAQDGAEYHVSLRRYDANLEIWTDEPLAQGMIPAPGAEFPWVDVLVKPEANAEAEPPRPIALSLGKNPALRFAAPGNEVTVSLVDGLPQLEISALAASASPENPAAFQVRRIGALDSTLSFDLRVEGTALNGTDYRFIGSEVTIPAGQATVEIAVEPLREVLSDEASIVALRLLPGANYGIRGRATAEMSLKQAVREVELSAVRTAMTPGGSAAQIMISRESPALSSELLEVRLRLSGNLADADFTITENKANGSEKLTPQPGTNVLSVFLLPGESFALLGFALPEKAPSAEARFLEVSLELVDGSPYQIGPRHTLVLGLARGLLEWAQAIDPSVTEATLSAWIAETPEGGLNRLVAYAYGLNPAMPPALPPYPLMQREAGQLALHVPGFSGATEVRQEIQFSSDFMDWEPVTDAVFLESYAADGQLFQKFRLSDDRVGAYRIKIEAR